MPTFRQVAVRVRPLSEKEIREGGTECVEARCETVKLLEVRIFVKFKEDIMKDEDMKICVLEAVEVIRDARCVASEGHRQFGDVGPRQSAATFFCLRSCHGLSVCLDVWTWAQVLKFSQKKTETSYSAFDLRL